MITGKSIENKMFTMSLKITVSRKIFFRKISYPKALNEDNDNFKGNKSLLELPPANIKRFNVLL